MANGIDVGATAATRARYNRIAPVYDLIETLSERSFKPWREKLWSHAHGDILEVGVGTGKNFPDHPRGAQVIGMDLADQMLARARERARQLHASVELAEGDVVSHGETSNWSFPTMRSTRRSQPLSFVLTRDHASCHSTRVMRDRVSSVPDPVRGLRELNRVVKPDGKILLLERVRIDRPMIGRIMDWLNPLIVRLWGANINRRTIENVQRAGLCIEQLEHLGPMGMAKLIVATPNK